VKRFRGGLVFEAHRLLYHSALGMRVTQKKKVGGLPVMHRPRTVHGLLPAEPVVLAFGVYARAEDAQGTPTQSRISPSILVYEDLWYTLQGLRVRVASVGYGL